MTDADDSGEHLSGSVAGKARSGVRHTRNTTASVSARLLTLAHERKEEYQLVLMQYGLERLLYRLGHSSHAKWFVVKGAMLFTLWAQEATMKSSTDASVHTLPLLTPHRATHDLDLLGLDSGEPAQIAQVFLDLCFQPGGEDDGLRFLSDTVHAERIRKDHKHGGVRVRLIAMLGKARIPLQIDIGFGDVVTPAPIETVFPPLLANIPVAQVRIYPRETVVAEKFEALVSIGMLNTRLKDFYDLWTLANHYAFDGISLSVALSATFERRGTALPESAPVALTPAFSSDATKRTQWAAFLRKGRLALEETPDFSAILELLGTFLLTPCSALVRRETFNATWSAGGPWVRGDAQYAQDT